MKGDTSIFSGMNTFQHSFKLYAVGDSSNALPVMVNCPHSGRNYSGFDLKDLACSLDDLRQMEDVGMDVMCGLRDLGRSGITALSGVFARSYVDFNRAETSLDPQSIREGLSTTLTCIPDSYALKGGGVIPVYAPEEGFMIYRPDAFPTEEDIRIRMVGYKHYHAALRETLSQMFQRHGGYALLDMHSCHPFNVPDEQGRRTSRADIIISDAFGHSCRPEFLQVVKAAYHKHGFENIDINTPFTGGYIVRQYGQVGARGWLSSTAARLQDVQAVQIEVNKALYMDWHPAPAKGRLRVNDNFKRLQGVHQDVFQDVAQYMKAQLGL